MATPTIEQIKEGLHDAVVEEAAVNLKKYYRVFDKTNLPANDQEYRKMAYDLINAGEFKTASGNTISRDKFTKDLQELSKEVGDSPEAKIKIAETIKEMEAVPDGEAIDKIANSIHSGVQKSTGFFNSFGGFFESIMNYIAGFFDWVSSGFHGSLMEHIGNRFAGTTANFVEHDLANLANNDDKVAAILTEDRIAQISNNVHASVVSSFSRKNVAVNKSRLAETAIEEDPIKGIIDDSVKMQVAAMFTKDNPATKEDETGKGRKMLKESSWTMRDKDVDDAEKAFVSAAQELIGEEGTKNLDDASVKMALAYKVNEKLDWSRSAETKLESTLTGADSPIESEYIQKIRTAASAYNNGLGSTSDKSTSTTNAALPNIQAPQAATPGR